jgi:hypothetical protein
MLDAAVIAGLDSTTTFPWLTSKRSSLTPETLLTEMVTATAGTADRIADRNTRTTTYGMRVLLLGCTVPRRERRKQDLREAKLPQRKAVASFRQR